jgi:hypothetical protein
VANRRTCRELATPLPLAPDSVSAEQPRRGSTKGWMVLGSVRIEPTRRHLERATPAEVDDPPTLPVWVTLGGCRANGWYGTPLNHPLVGTCAILMARPRATPVGDWRPTAGQAHETTIESAAFPLLDRLEFRDTIPSCS